MYEEVIDALRVKLEGNTTAALREYCADLEVKIPMKLRKGEVVDTIISLFRQDTANEETDEDYQKRLESICVFLGVECDLGKPDYVVEHENRTAAIEKEVALAAVDHARKDATAKSAKKHFEAMRDELINHLNTEPYPTTKEFDFDSEAQQEKQKVELKMQCQECHGIGHDGNGVECVNCEGTGDVVAEPEAEPDGDVCDTTPA